MRITELFTAQSIALDEALQTQEEILSRLVELQATHGNITDKDAYKKALYAREAEGSTYVDNGITVPHAKTDVVTRPSLAALRLAKPVQYNAEDDGTTDLLFAIAAPENGSLHVDMLARMMQMLMNEDFVAKLKAAKTPAEFLDCIDAQEDAQFGTESFTQQAIPQQGYRILAVTACVNGIAHTYMAAEALTKAGDKLGLPTKVETNGSDGAKNILTKEEIANCDGIIVAAEKKVDTARFDGKPVLFTRVDDGIHKPEELIKKIAHGEVPVFRAEGGAEATESADTKDSFGRSLYKNLMNGVSGSGKSSLVNEILYKHLAKTLNRARTIPGKHKDIVGMEQLDKVIAIDQSPIGRTPRSNPATYTGVFDQIRDLFAATQDAKARGYKKGRFSFNVKGGRCEACSGDGILKIEMHFLPDVYVPCEVCGGKRYNRETLEVKYKGKSIYDVLNMTVEEALGFFDSIPSIKRKIQTLYDVGLSYIRLGQPSTELSGGEAQRIKLATELSKRSTGRTIYILDEPTTGLHFADVHKLIEILQRLAEGGNTVVVIEHNLDVIKTADYIIDIGPEGGDKGGTVIAKGTPEEVAKAEKSYTGKYVKKYL